MFLAMIKENGGFTLNKDLQSKKEGFVCAIEGHETIFNIETVSELDIIEYIASKKEIVKTNNNLCFGSWLDDNKLYLDISEVLDDKEQALEIAKDRKQLAIFNLSNFESIYL